MESVVGVDSLFSKVYAGKTVLVTGHTGFKGSWLTLWLQMLGARVVGYALSPPTTPSLFHLANVQEGITHIEGDVRDDTRLREAVLTVQPAIVFHLAAQALVRPSYSNPRETYETNVMGTVNLLEAIRASRSVKVCVNITSDKCYDNREWVYAYRENDPMGGRDPYSSSKGCAELVTAAYRDSFFRNEESASVRLASARAGNVIGGGDWAQDRIIPDCVRALSKGSPVAVRNPHAIRPWQYVLEPLSGYLWLGARMWEQPGVFEGAWNFGPYSAGNISVAQVVNQALAIWGQGQWNQPPGHRDKELHEARTLKLDITKVTSALGWVPVLSVSEAISETIGWYLDYYRNSEMDVKAATLAHINRFVQIASVRNAIWTVKADEPL